MVSWRPSEALYPFKSNFLDVIGGKLHYLDEGAGEPVVMLHGNPSWSFLYRDLVQALRGGYRCVVPDHIGMGLSDKPADEDYRYTLDRRVDDLERLLDKLGLKDGLTLVLHDWGGMIGMAFATRHPERIKRLVITNTAAFGLPTEKTLPLPLWVARDTKLGALLVRGFNAFAEGAVRTCVVRPMRPEVREGFVGPYGSWADRIATLRFVQDIPLKPGDPAWDTVQKVEAGLSRFKDVPKMIAWGEKDYVFDRHFLDGWLRRFPDAEVHRFPDAGHYVLEDAGDRIVPLVRSFLERHPLAVAR